MLRLPGSLRRYCVIFREGKRIAVSTQDEWTTLFFIAIKKKSRIEIYTTASINCRWSPIPTDRKPSFARPGSSPCCYRSALSLLDALPLIPRTDTWEEALAALPFASAITTDIIVTFLSGFQPDLLFKRLPSKARRERTLDTQRIKILHFLNYKFCWSGFPFAHFCFIAFSFNLFPLYFVLAVYISSLNYINLFMISLSGVHCRHNFTSSLSTSVCLSPTSILLSPYIPNQCLSNPYYNRDLNP